MDNQGYVNNFIKFIETTEIDKSKDIKKALDFGCGPGPVLKVLLERLGIKVDIYDQYFFPKKTLFNKKFDLITCTEVLEHLKKPLETLTLLESLLNENGVLAVTTLFHTTSNDFIKWWYRRDPTHICFYSPHTFKWVAEHFNFNVKVMDNRSVCALQKNT